MKLICFPHAGGFASYYNFLKKARFDFLESVHLHEYPGRGKRMRKVKALNFEDYISDAVDCVVECGVESDDFVLFGHSMGAFIAYETGKCLKENYGINPSGIIVSGQNPPFDVYRDARLREITYEEKFWNMLVDIPDYIMTNIELRDFYLQYVYQDMELLKTYRPVQPDESSRLDYGMVIYGKRDVLVRHEFESHWSYLFQTLSEKKVFDGGHFYFENNKEEVVKAIDSFVNKIINMRGKMYVY